MEQEQIQETKAILRECADRVTIEDIKTGLLLMAFNLEELEKIKEQKEEELRHESLSTGRCYKCGGILSYHSYNEGDNWSVECLNCDILFDED